MGLDISGVVIGPVKTTDKENMGEVFVLEGFERSLLPEEIVTIDYEFENEDYVADGPSMSYGVYNGFRRALSMAALGKPVEEVWKEVEGLKDDQPYPSAIYHILNFADNEGYIGPKALKELDAYFDKHGESISTNLEEYYSAKFVQLKECVKETAAKNGYLKFA